MSSLSHLYVCSNTCGKQQRSFISERTEVHSSEAAYWPLQPHTEDTLSPGCSPAVPRCQGPGRRPSKVPALMLLMF